MRKNFTMLRFYCFTTILLIFGYCVTILLFYAFSVLLCCTGLLLYYSISPTAMGKIMRNANIPQISPC